MLQTDRSDLTVGERSLGEKGNNELPNLNLLDLQGNAPDQSSRTPAGSKWNENVTDSVPAAAADQHLPGLEIHHTGFWESVENVASELGKGAWKEVTEHPGRVIADAAIGFGVGVGMSMVAPVVAIGAGVAMAGLTAYEVATHAGKWYHDAAVVAKPEGHDGMEIFAAKQGVESFGGGAVDVAAGVAGGIGGAKFAQTEVFADIKNVVADTVGKALHPSYFDADGLPLKLPLPNNSGSAYLKYNPDGELTGITEKRPGGWSTIFQRQTDAKGASTWMVNGDNLRLDVGTSPEVYQGTVSLSQGNRVLTLLGKDGTETLSADAPSTYTRTAEQLEVAKVWHADFVKNLAAYRAANSEEGASGLGAGGAAMGLGMMVR